MSSRRLALPLAARVLEGATLLSRLPSRLIDFSALTRSRRSLSRLDDHLLRDIGLTRAQARAEADRRGWDAPSHWKG